MSKILDIQVGENRSDDGQLILDLTSRLYRQYVRRSQANLLRIGLSSAIYNVLDLLRHTCGMTGSQIASALGVDIASISSLAVRMERDGLIERIKSETDKRSSIFLMTPSAWEKLVQADEIMKLQFIDATAKMPTSERVMAAKILKKLVSNISED